MHGTNEDDVIKNCLIEDLYEKKSNWVILCRINYLNKVECNNGLTANNFMLADEKGN